MIKKIIQISLAFLACFSYTMSVASEVKTQKVCVDKITKEGKNVRDKQGKKVQECKEMRVHKKLDGTKVPEKK